MWFDRDMRSGTHDLKSRGERTHLDVHVDEINGHQCSETLCLHLYEDSLAALEIVNNATAMKRTNHVVIRHHSPLCEHIGNGFIKITLLQ